MSSKATSPKNGSPPKKVPVSSTSGSKVRNVIGLVLAIVCVGCAVLVQVQPDLLKKANSFWKATKNTVSLHSTTRIPPGGLVVALERDLKAEDDKPSTPFSFSVHFNGDGLSGGQVVSTDDFSGLNSLLRKLCPQIPEVRKIGKDSPSDIQRICDPDQGARLFTHTGIRVYSFHDIKPNMRTYVIPQGIHFVWPLGKVGDILTPENVISPVEGKQIKLKQLSMSPRVFTVENFMSEEELQVIMEHNKDLVQPSEVGFSGWRDSTRTSHTAWDFSSWAARKVQRRSFALLGIDYEPKMADATQVLRYQLDEWYKPHTDWFDAKGYDGHDPTVNNGTNRFATVFLYLSDVEEGGTTVFPHSKTHEGYNGERLTQPGTEKRPGFIAQADAEWVCNSSSTALRSIPKAGNAVLFYSQGPDSALDPLSLHGGCPVWKGTKWSANVWVWNRIKPSKDDAKDGKPKETNSISMQFQNALDETVTLYWDSGEELVLQTTIDAGDFSPMTTYHGHQFVAKTADGTVVHKFTAKQELQGKDHNEVIG